MKTIEISYKGNLYCVRVKRVNAFPNDVFEIDFSNSTELTAMMESPVFIEEKSDILALPEAKNIDQRELLNRFVIGIQENYPIN